MADFINGVKVTINMMENGTTYQEKYGKMIPGKSNVILKVTYEIEDKSSSFTGTVEFGKYVSHLIYVPFIKKIKINNYGDTWLLNDKNIIYEHRDNGNLVIKMHSRGVLSKEYDQKYENTYITATSKKYYNTTEDIHKFSFSLFNIYPWILPKIDILDIQRNTSENKVILKIKFIAYLKNELFHSNFFKLYIKKQTESYYQEFKVLDDCEVIYNHTPDLINGEWYDDFIDITINNVSDYTNNAHFTFYNFDDFVSYPEFIIPAVYQLLCFGGDGDRIAFGKKCEQPGFENNLSSWFYKDVQFMDTVNFHKSPSGIASDNVIINYMLDNTIPEVLFGNDWCDDESFSHDDQHYPYKNVYQIDLKTYDMTVSDFFNKSILEVFPQKPLPQLCPRVYIRDIGNNRIEVCVMTLNNNYASTNLKIRITFSD